MKNKCAAKSNRGRKPKRAVLSGIKPDQETFEEIRCRIILGSNEWPMVAVRQLIATGQRQNIAPYMGKLIVDCERAALDGDADWFRRQANAIEKGGLPERAGFNAKVVYLLEIAWCETQGRPDNWRPLSDAERKAFPFLKNLERVPHLVTFTPAGKFTNATASDIYNALEKREVKQQDLSQLVPGYKDSDKKKASENEPSLVVEGCPFENKNRVMEAIHKLATRLQFALEKQPRKRGKTFPNAADSAV